MNPIFRDSCLRITVGLCISVVDGASVLGASHTPALSSVSEWLSGAAEAMGGEAKLRTLASVEMGVCPCDITRAIETPEGALAHKLHRLHGRAQLRRSRGQADVTRARLFDDRLKVVSGKTTVGSGANRFEIYPFRTATGERQMMIY